MAKAIDEKALCETVDKHIGWAAMVKKLEEKGHSKKAAEKIAGYINKEKYGGGGKH